jgi:hypothetical protein
MRETDFVLWPIRERVKIHNLVCRLGGVIATYNRDGSIDVGLPRGANKWRLINALREHHIERRGNFVYLPARATGTDVFDLPLYHHNGYHCMATFYVAPEEEQESALSAGASR